MSSGCGCKDVYTVFTLLIRGGKIKYFSHGPRIIIIHLCVVPASAHR